MRLFTAIDPDAAALERLEKVLAVLRPTARVSWSRIENLHITTKFIGEWPEARLEGLKNALRPIERRPPVPISLRGLGWFPAQRRPRVLYAGIDGGDGLPNLAEATDGALAAIGIAREAKPYSPHLTLARLKDAGAPDELLAEAAKYESVEFGAFTADCFSLYLSQLTPRGSIYTKLARFPFRS